MQYVLYFWGRGEGLIGHLGKVSSVFSQEIRQKGFIQFTLNGMCPLLKSVFKMIHIFLNSPPDLNLEIANNTNQISDLGFLVFFLLKAGLPLKTFQVSLQDFYLVTCIECIFFQH